MNTNKAKHTPGPWKLDGAVVEAKWENGESVMICQAGGTRWGGCSSATEYNKRMREENTVNAALIAAAPELLAALEFCADALNTEAGGLYKAHIEQARAAIAKAKGDK